MPYNNSYNKKVANKVKTIDEAYINHIGENYPMQGGSLDTGYDTSRIIGGAKGIEDYVKGVLEGTYLTPTQGLPSSSMSGLGYSGGMTKFVKGGFKGPMTPEQKANWLEKRNATLARKKEEKRLANFDVGYDEGVAKRQLDKEGRKEARVLGGPQALEKLAMKDLRKSERFDKSYEKESKKIHRGLQREEKGLGPKRTNTWIDFVKMLSGETGKKYNEVMRDPQTKVLYNRQMGRPGAIERRIAQYPEGYGKVNK